MGQRVTVFKLAILLLTLLVSCNVKGVRDTVPSVIGIEDPDWQLIEISGSPVSRPADGLRPFIRFDAAKKQASGFAGCNNFFGSYELDGSSLKFGPVGATRMFCEGVSGEVELRFMQALEQTRTWELRENTLILLKDSKVLARFAMDRGNDSATVGELQITGTVWQWVRTLYNDDRKAVPEDPNYTVQFLEDGTVNVKADCNLKGGTYSAEGRRLSIEIIHSTMATCPESSLEDEFTRTLSAAAIFFIKDGDLYIDLKYDTGTMRFSKQ